MRQQHGTELMVSGRDLALAGHGGGGDMLDLATAGGAGGSPSDQVSPLHKLHMLLKGRYRWALGLAAAGLLVGAAAGYLVGKPIYVSRGQVRVLPKKLSVIGESDDRTMGFFDSFVDSQVTLLQTQRVLDMAVQNEAWRRLGKPSTPEAVEELGKNLDFTRQRGSQFITISYSDKDGAVAQAAVKSLLESYDRIVGEQETKSGEQVLDILQQEMTKGSNEIRMIREQIMQKAQAYGTDDLQKKYDFDLQELEKQEVLLRDLDLRVAATTTTAATAKGGATTRPLANEEIAARDAAMAQLMSDRRQVERRIKVAAQNVGANHPDMVRLRQEQTAIDEQIAERASEYRKLVENGVAVAPPVGGSVAGEPVVSREVLIARRDAVKTMYEENRDKLLALGKSRLEIDQLHQREAEIRDRLDLFKKRQEQLALQDKVAGQIQIVSFGDRPTLLKDTRIRYAGAGGFGGSAVGLGLVVLVGLLDRRFRSPEELRTSLTGSPVLGVLPDLPDDLSDPEQAALTAHFVHQIRTLLQIWDSGAGTQVFSVTSPVSGTGKTSLTLALGVSFAAADSRTLLIDCDLIGGGLTTRANAIVKRKIGRILQREGLLTDKQLDEALKLASGSRRRLGEILVELGHLKEADLDSALVRQQKGSVGLLDAINGEEFLECVAETGIAGLSILPLGGAQAQHASKVTPHNLRRVLNEARKHYDTILIDTGPVPGSLEAAVVAAEVDGVILCVSRGEQRPLAEKCVQHLLSVGAKVAGVVFNRAKGTDMSVYGTAVRTSMPATSVPATNGDSARFGPMAQAVSYGGPAAPGDESPAAASDATTKR